jgi:chromosome segregation ATPase
MNIEELKNQHQKEIDNLKEQHKNEIVNINNTHNNEITKLKNEYENKLSKLASNKDNEISQLENKIKQLELQITNLNETIASKQNEIDSLNNELSNIKSQIDDYLAKVKSAQDEAANAKLHYEQLEKKLNEEYKIKCDELEKQAAEKSKAFKEFHLSEVEKMKNEFLSALKMLEDKNAYLTNEIEDLQSFLSKRPSRDEDLDEINRLNEEIEKKDKELKESTVLLEQFRNELINREETYNGYFDRKPKVGYIDPIKEKKEKEKKKLKAINGGIQKK